MPERPLRLESPSVSTAARRRRCSPTRGVHAGGQADRVDARPSSSWLGRVAIVWRHLDATCPSREVALVRDIVVVGELRHRGVERRVEPGREESDNLLGEVGSMVLYWIS